MKKILVFLILLLFISTTIVPAFEMKESVIRNDIADFSGDIIYVDDDNIEGPWDGTLEHPYYFVQDGVEAANPGDTVYVFSGLYEYQYIEIHETINLIGEDKETTIFACNINSWAILIYADYVNVSGFTFTHTGFIKGTRMMGIGASYCTISDNIFSDDVPINCQVGICINNGHYNTITRNEFASWAPQHVAIQISHSNHNIISENIIKKLFFGIRVNDSDDNTIINNQFTTVNFVMEVVLSSGNKITRNYINGGIFGIFFGDASGNEVTYNRFENKSRKREGIWIIGRYVLFFNSTNYWDHNYWGRRRILPKIIFGYNDVKDPWYKHLPNAFDIDWHPAKTPYEI